MKCIKYISTLLILGLTVACSDRSVPKHEVELTILNDTLFYYAKGDSLFREGHRRYENAVQKRKSYNVVKYRLTNNTDKKLLFFLNDIDLIQLYGLNVKVEYNGDEIKGSNILSHPAHDDCGLCAMQALDDQRTEEMEKQRLLGEPDEYYIKYLRQAVIVGPGESWDFSAMLSLPFAIEGEYIFMLPEFSDLKLSVEIEIAKNKVITFIKESDIENLKRNNVEIFDGKLTSNEVRLIPRY